MLRCAQRIVQRTQGLTLEQFQSDLDCVEVSQWNFTIIGEAMNQLRQLDAAVVEQFSEFDRIIRFRNQLVHGYRDVSDAITWRIIQEKLPVLVRQLEASLDDAG